MFDCLTVEDYLKIFIFFAKSFSAVENFEPQLSGKNVL